MNGGGAEREGDTESEAGSRLWAISSEPDVGLELTDCEIVTWAEVGRLTDWATQAPLAMKTLNTPLLLLVILRHRNVYSYTNRPAPDRQTSVLTARPESTCETEYQLPTSRSKWKKQQEGTGRIWKPLTVELTKGRTYEKKKTLNRKLTNTTPGKKRKKRARKEGRKPFIVKIKWRTSGAMKCDNIHKTYMIGGW